MLLFADVFRVQHGSIISVKDFCAKIALWNVKNYLHCYIIPHAGIPREAKGLFIIYNHYPRHDNISMLGFGQY